MVISGSDQIVQHGEELTRTLGRLTHLSFPLDAILRFDVQKVGNEDKVAQLPVPTGSFAALLVDY